MAALEGSGFVVLGNGVNRVSFLRGGFLCRLFEALANISAEWCIEWRPHCASLNAVRLMLLPPTSSPGWDFGNPGDLQSGPLSSYGTLLTDTSGARSYVWSKVLGVYQSAAQRGRARGMYERGERELPRENGSYLLAHLVVTGPVELTPE